MNKNRNKEIIEFLTELNENNNKDWFDLNRKRYNELRNYFIELTSELIAAIGLFDPSVAFLDPKKCIFRINRDIRFSKDKNPYKTNFGAYIVPGGKKSGNAGYYLHFEPDNSFVAGGVHCPENDVLSKVRWSIYENVDDFMDIVSEEEFEKTFGELQGEKLKNPPRGFDKDFTQLDYLKFKEYTVIRNITNKELFSTDFVENIVDLFYKMTKFNGFINSALK